MNVIFQRNIIKQSNTFLLGYLITNSFFDTFSIVESDSDVNVDEMAQLQKAEEGRGCRKVVIAACIFVQTTGAVF